MIILINKNLLVQVTRGIHAPHAIISLLKLVILGRLGDFINTFTFARIGNAWDTCTSRDLR